MTARAALLLLLLAGCGTTPVSLAYDPTHPLPSPAGPAVLARPEVVDARGGAPRALGAVHGDLGFLAQTLTIDQPAAQQVGAAFGSALLARGMLAPPGTARFDLRIRLNRLAVGEALDRHAAVDLVLTVTRRDTGQVVYTDAVSLAAGEADLPSLDSMAYAPVAAVTALGNATMSRAIDQALDKPGFRAALAS